jgi:hypothetical protein
METTSSSSYSVDQSPFLLDFVKTSCKKDLTDELEDHDLVVAQQLSLSDDLDDKSTYDLAGWATFKAKQLVSDCKTCIEYLTATNPVLPASTFTVFKSFGGLTHPSTELYELIRQTLLKLL